MDTLTRTASLSLGSTGWARLDSARRTNVAKAIVDVRRTSSIFRNENAQCLTLNEHLSSKRRWPSARIHISNSPAQGSWRVLNQSGDKKTPKFMLTGRPARWLEVEASGVKWLNAPLDPWMLLPHLNFMPESSGIQSTRRIASRSRLAGDGTRPRRSSSYQRRIINSCSLCRQRSLLG